MPDLVSAASTIIMVWAAWSWIKTPKVQPIKQAEEKELPKWELMYWKDGKLTSTFIHASDYNSAVAKSDVFLRSEREKDPSIEYAALHKVVS